jgi:hypothetical protein
LTQKFLFLSVPKNLPTNRGERSFFLALTEELARSGPAEFLTFDKRVVNVAASNAPSVKVNLLPS